MKLVEHDLRYGGRKLYFKPKDRFFKVNQASGLKCIFKLFRIQLQVRVRKKNIFIING
ncbi:hypothetical protein D3C85_1730560 [compost metagenome]